MSTNGSGVVGIGEFGAPSPELADEVGVPRTAALPSRLRPVVEDLAARAPHVVTLADLARYDTGHDPQQLARALRSRGWLYPLRARGAWSAPFVGPGPHLGDFRELHARLAVHPDTPVCLAGLYAAQTRGYLARPAEPHIGYPPGLKVPRCLDGFPVLRWAPQIPLDETLDGLPVWRDETLLTYMAAKPAQVPWEDVAEWLPEICANIDGSSLIAELGGRRRSVWMKAAYLVSRGGQETVADDVLAAAAPGRGPYVFGHRDRRIGNFVDPPQWVPKYGVMDYVLATWWLPKWR